MRFGAHVRRGSGGVARAVEEAGRRGADCAQVFVSNPRAWAPPAIRDADAAAFREAWVASGLGPLVAHAPYLVNIASSSPDVLSRSRELAWATLGACAALGVDALVVHAGTGHGPRDEVVSRAAASLRAIAPEPGPVRVLVELEEGIASAAASTVAEAAALLGRADLPHVGLCLDTCHLFAAGHPLDTEAGAGDLLDELRREGLLDRVGLVHANDARFERGSRRDRHENIGDGFIGVDGFRALLARPEVADLAFILETPGDAERHARDIALLRGLGRAYGSSSARGPSW